VFRCRSEPVPDQGFDCAANYEAARTRRATVTSWLGGWFEWGVDDAEDLDYVDAEDLRGSTLFYAGVTFEAKANPLKLAGNEAWLNARLSEGFLATWFDGYHRLVRLRYPDQLLAQSTLDAQGRNLGEWIVETFATPSANPPPP
jgi:hypothetical protein